MTDRSEPSDGDRWQALHRHLTLERYELALEEDPPLAARLRELSRNCKRCASATARPPLAPALALWELPATIDGPVAWQRAFRRAIAPRPQRSSGWRFARWQLISAAALLIVLLLVTAFPAAANAGPDSSLFPVRGLEEEARWNLTPRPYRAEVDADLASAYLWQARLGAARHDRPAYEASMQRFFKWGERLKTDIRSAPESEQSRARAAVATATSLVPGLATSAPNPGQAERAGSLLQEVEEESQDGNGALGGGGSGTVGADDGR